MTDTPPQSSATVLVVEDDSLVRLVVADLLRDTGYNVIEGRDGQEALEILEVQPHVDALFTDVMMPRLDGLSLARIVAGDTSSFHLLFDGCLLAVGEPIETADFRGMFHGSAGWPLPPDTPVRVDVPTIASAPDSSTSGCRLGMS